MNTTGLFSAYAKPVICWNYRPLTSYCKAMILNKKKNLETIVQDNTYMQQIYNYRIEIF